MGQPDQLVVIVGSVLYDNVLDKPFFTWHADGPTQEQWGYARDTQIDNFEGAPLPMIDVWARIPSTTPRRDRLKLARRRLGLPAKVPKRRWTPSSL